MNLFTGDTITVNSADTLPSETRVKEYRIGRFIPVHEQESAGNEIIMPYSGGQPDYYSGTVRDPGQPIPPEAFDIDFSFALLSFAFVLLALLIAYAGKTLSSGLAFLSFRRQNEIPAPSTSGVFSWPPAFRNIFTVINVSIFSASSLILSGTFSMSGNAASVKLISVIAGGFLGAILLRHLACIIVAETTGLTTVFREYMNVVYNGWFLNALIMFLLNFLILFPAAESPNLFIISGLIASFLLLIVRILRLLSIFVKRHISILYFLLYLCALEVLPVLMIMKVFGIF
jgi:hypothetical protein